MDINLKQIQKVFKSIHPEKSMSNEVKQYIAVMIQRLFIVIMNQCVSLMYPKNIQGKSLPKQHEMTVATLETAVRLLFPSTLSKFAISEIRRTKPQNKTSLSVALVQKGMERFLSENVDAAVSLAMTVVLEYVIAEVVELSGNVASDENRKRLSVSDVTTAIDEDTDLKKLLANVLP